MAYNADKTKKKVKKANTAVKKSFPKVKAKPTKVVKAAVSSPGRRVVKAAEMALIGGGRSYTSGQVVNRVRKKK